MKKIINGKKYDTETAEKVGYYSDGRSWRDFGHFEETLYRKKTGEFFLFGEGGAASKYGVYIGDNSFGSGDRIIPMSEDDAKAWAEARLDGDEYESIFGEVEE